MWVDNASIVTGNAAAFNAGHGIEAYCCVDGGGNRARGNRENPQCVGVACLRCNRTSGVMPTDQSTGKISQSGSWSTHATNS